MQVKVLQYLNYSRLEWGHQRKTEMVANIQELESEKYEMAGCNLGASLFKLKHQQSIGLEKLNRLAKA